jgi:hypothetical protein
MEADEPCRACHQDGAPSQIDPGRRLQDSSPILTADANVHNSCQLHFVGPVNIWKIYYGRLLEKALDLRGIECSKHIPLSDQNQGVGAIQTTMRVRRLLNAFNNLLGVLHYRRAIRTHLCASVLPSSDNRDRKSTGHIVRVRPE